MIRISKNKGIEIRTNNRNKRIETRIDNNIKRIKIIKSKNE